MNILGISGSPRRDGNTSFAVNYALNCFKNKKYNVKYISLADFKIKNCISCWKCADDEKCWQEDGMSEIIEYLLWCDGLIIGSPVYFGMISGQLKVMMDRSIVLRAHYDENFPLAGKVGGAIACAHARNGGQEITIQNIHTYMLQMSMKVINDGPIYSHSGGTIMGDAKEDTWGLETVENLVKHICRCLEK